MKAREFHLTARDGTRPFVRHVAAQGETRAVAPIIHGMAEHSGRYLRLAQAFAERGHDVYMSDHRGHGHTATCAEDLGFLGEADGFAHMVSDQCLLMDEVRHQLPGVPLFLLGHSMGSYVARAVAAERGAELSGLLLCGSTQGPPAQFKTLRQLAGLERLRLGKRGRSPILRKLSTDSFNKPFAPHRTPHDWISRDEEEVDAFAADPLCGFTPTTQFWRDLLGGIAYVCSQDAYARYPRSLPVLILAGEKDTTLDRLKGLRALQHAFRGAQMQNITTRVYAEARHELFNELNRDEVTRDVLDWLDEQLA